jgi:mono/diheme cytochrome c family protein
VTEIPEHLLKRAAAARAKASGGEAPADAPAAAPSTAPATTTASTPAVPAPSKPAPAAPPPPKPDAPYVAAAKSRRKIPSWAMLGLSILPVWGLMYVRSLTPATVQASGPLGEGAEVYGNCSTCHGSNGEGQAGNGYQFSKGEIWKTFPNIEDQLRFVYGGSDAYALAGVEIPGDPGREGGAHVTKARGVMPRQGDQLTEAEILAVVCHERYGVNADLSRENEVFELWCSEESPIFEALESGESTFETLHEDFEGVIEIGYEPKAGSGPKAP